MKVRCTYCGAEFEVPDTVKTTTCPYCALTLTVKAPGEVEAAAVDHFYFPTTSLDPYRSLMNFVRREYGVPSDVEASSSLEKRELHYVPIYFFHVKGRLEVEDPDRRVTYAEEVIFCPLIAMRRNRMFDVLRNHIFAVRGRRFFEESVKRKGVFHEPVFDREEAHKRVRDALIRALRDEARANARKFRVRSEELHIEYRGLVHYPIWYLTYRYQDRSYEAYVDGADGRVILAEYPQTSVARAVQIGLAIAFLAAGGIIGGILALLMNTIYTVITGLITGGVAAIPLLVRGARRKARGSEVFELEEKLQSPFFRALYRK